MARWLLHAPGYAALLFLLLAGCGSGGSANGGDPGGGDPGGGGNPGGGKNGRSGEPPVDPGGGKSGKSGKGGNGGNSLGYPAFFEVENFSSRPREETIRISVPFPKGKVFGLDSYGVKGFQTAWLPLQKWSDGSVRLAQAQFTDSFAGNEKKVYEVEKGVKAKTGSFTPNDWVERFGSHMRIGARVTDSFGVSYEAEISNSGEVVQETPLVRVQRFRVYHKAAVGKGMGRDFLTSTFYLTEFRDVPFLCVDWVLGNDYLGIDDPEGNQDPNLYPLGAIDIDKASFLIMSVAGVNSYQSDMHAIADAELEPGGWVRFDVMKDTWIADGATRRYRFLARIEDPQAPNLTKKKWADGLWPFAQDPFRPLAQLETWQKSGAFGLHGGPITGPLDAGQMALDEYNGWRSRASRFGTWDSFGDVKRTSTTGTPRNAPVSPELAHAVQGMEPRLLMALEQKAWAQAMRPYHLWGLEVGSEQDILLWDPIPHYPGSRDLSRQSLGRRALWKSDPFGSYRNRVDFKNGKNHGWNGFDHGHWTTDLLFDYWSVTGDAWAKEELRQLGESLKALMRLKRYATSSLQAARAEGWCMVGFVQSYLATQDSSIKEYALRRVREVIDARRRKTHPSKVLINQWNYPGAGYPSNSSFFMPWQHGAVLYGFLAAHEFFEDPACLRIAEDVVTTVEYSWVTNYQDPKFGFVQNGLRYYVPYSIGANNVPADFFDKTLGIKWGDSPLGGAHGFLTGGLLLLSERSSSVPVKHKAAHYGKILFGTLKDSRRWYKWNTVAVESLLRDT